MSIQQNFPAISPSLNLNFARSKTLDPRITFSRTSTATRVNEQGLIEVVSADIPRFDHEYDASTGVIKSLGLLVEEQRSNRVTNNEDLSLWKQNSNPTLNSNDTVSPDGNTTADKVTQTNQVFTGVSTDMSGITTNTVYSCSVFIKPDGDTTTRFGFYDTSNWQGSLDTDWSSGEPSTNGSLGGASDIVYEEYPNGWYRASFKASTQSNAFAGTVSFHCHPDRTGTGKSAWFWGAQLEAGAFPTSYIPTSGGTATRNPDNASMTGNNFSDWYNPTEGTFNSDVSFNSNNATHYIWQVGKASNRMLSAGRVGGNSWILLSINNNSFTDNLSSTYNSGRNKWCASYSNDGFFGVENGGNIISSNNADVPTLDINILYLGSYVNSSLYLNGHISQLTYYPVRLPNSTLQTLTK